MEINFRARAALAAAAAAIAAYRRDVQDDFLFPVQLEVVREETDKFVCAHQRRLESLGNTVEEVSSALRPQMDFPALIVDGNRIFLAGDTHGRRRGDD